MKTILRKIILFLAAALFAASLPAEAHHSFAAQFDASKPVSLTGRVTRVDWQNPHIFIYIDVANEETGAVENWKLELGGPNSLMRMGWRRNSLQNGDLISVEGSMARDGSNLANARTIVKDDTGQEMFAGSSQGQEEGR